MEYDDYNKMMSSFRFVKGDTGCYKLKRNRTKPLNFDSDIHRLKTDLCPNNMSSVFVVNDTKIPRIFKVLVFGEKGTPYSDCGFVFTIFLGDNYPENPPIVEFDTNLFESQSLSPFIFTQGRVVLPILGNFFEDISTNAWENTTSLFQVIDSIKKIFCVDEPYFANIMNFEKRYSIEGKIESKKYNQKARMISVAEGIVEILENKLIEKIFGKVPIFHYLIKNKEILDTLNRWRSEYDDNLDTSAKIYKSKTFMNWMDSAEQLLKSHKEKHIM